MMRREVPPMRPPLAALLLAACMCAPLARFGAEGPRRPPHMIPKFDIHVSGPASLGPDESLAAQRFVARLTNRSAEPQVLFVREGYLMNARWNWTVTDTKGQYLGMALVIAGYCGTLPYDEKAAEEARHIRDKDLTVLAPGESRGFPIAGPSDDYDFPKAGTYHLAVTLTYVPPNAPYYFDEHSRRQKAEGYEQWDLSTLSVDGLQAMQNSLSIRAASDTWSLTVPTARMHGNGPGMIPLTIR